MGRVAFLLCIGLAAIVGRSGAMDDDTAQETATAVEVTEEDGAIIAGLTHLFEVEELHIDTELNLRRLSRKLGLPDRSVSRAINKTQNLSVSQFVNGFRIRDAARLLETSDQTILQISLASGFMTKSNFNREFARVTGQTPSHWRQAKGMKAEH